MKKAAAKKSSGPAEEMRAEYRFDYRKAKPNRFADRLSKGSRIVVLDADVARVFTSQESVNSVLRALLTTMPKSPRS